MSTAPASAPFATGPEIQLLEDDDGAPFLFASGHQDLDLFCCGAIARLALRHALPETAPRPAHCRHGWAKWHMVESGTGPAPVLALQVRPGPGRIPVTYLDWTGLAPSRAAGDGEE